MTDDVVAKRRIGPAPRPVAETPRRGDLLTVGDLIRELSHYPAETRVLIYDPAGCQERAPIIYQHVADEPGKPGDVELV